MSNVNQVNLRPSSDQRTVVGALALALLIWISPTQADHRDYSIYGSGYKGGHHPYRYEHRRYGHRRHGHRHRPHGDRSAYLAGGLIVGALIVDALHRRQHYPSTLRHARGYPPARAKRRLTRELYRDRYGDCYERTYGRRGDEILIQIDPAFCRWRSN